MSHSILNSVMATALLAAATTAAPTPGGHGPGIVDDIVAITLAPKIGELMELRLRPSCWQECVDCVGEGEHSAALGSSHRSKGAHTTRTHVCDSVAGSGSCSDHHAECFAQQQDRDVQARQAVFAALSEGDSGTGALLELLATRPDLVWLNRERSAIQILSCTGGIFAHLPVEVTYRAAQ